jgi:hypothetical protein
VIFAFGPLKGNIGALHHNRERLGCGMALGHFCDVIR